MDNIVAFPSRPPATPDHDGALAAARSLAAYFSTIDQPIVSSMGLPQSLFMVRKGLSEADLGRAYRLGVLHARRQRRVIARLVDWQPPLTWRARLQAGLARLFPRRS